MNAAGDANGEAEIISVLRRELGDDAVISGATLSDKYAVDVSGENPQKPIAVALPRSTEDVATIVRACSTAGQPIVIQGGLTGLSGGATPQPGVEL